MNQSILDFAPLQALIASHLDKTFPAAAVEILHRGRIAYCAAFGYLDPESRTHPATLATRFDLASVSKLFTVTAFMTLVEQGQVTLDEPVSTILPEFNGPRPIAPYPDPLHPGAFIEIEPATSAPADAGRVTFRHLLAHNSGLPAWLALWRIPERAERRDAALGTSFCCPTGTHVIYSDIGLILLGFAMEKIAGRSLDQIVRERVSRPLGLSMVGYGPIPCDTAAPTEFYAHLNARMCGQVHDENAWSLGGVAGHAGLFGAVHDVATLGEMFRRGGTPVLSPETVAEMRRLQAEEGAVRRGLGFLLWSPDPVASSHPLSAQCFGHLGFTGTSLWVDPPRDLVIACLTNRVYYGRNNAEAIGSFRVEMQNIVREIIDARIPG